MTVEEVKKIIDEESLKGKQKMIRNGEFCIYNDNEYELNSFSFSKLV